MSNYLLVYTGGSMPESENEIQAVMKAWTDWFTTLGDAVVDSGNPIGHAKTVNSKGVIRDGVPGEPATGYSIIKAGSLDEAAKLAVSCPHLLDNGDISVYETFEAM
jgi:hypothetical protein